MRKLILAFATLVLIPLTASSQPEGWNDPFPPHKVIDNLYYVGTTMLSSYLITSDEGHILVNSGYESTIPVIQASVEELGFDFKDIKILISGHAHADHIEGDALVKELTGAEVVVGRLEVPAVEALTTPSGKKSPIDRIVDEGDTVTLGRTTLTAHLQSGHTKGCLGWSLPLSNYYTFIECSLNGQYLQYIDNEDHPTIAVDLQETFNKARKIKAEIFLSSHGMFYGLEEKHQRLVNRRPGDENPFIDPQGYVAHIDEFEKIFQETLAQQLAEAEE